MEEFAGLRSNGLSSGEKILMSFAFCVYYSNDQRQNPAMPKLILLDEVDAPLHPSMSRALISAIRDTLVGQYKIKVIASTHSPSTVAMAHDDEIYVMRPNGLGLQKTTRSQAISALTVGVPTLSVSFEGRRQVFTESIRDAKIYETVYQILSSQLNSERSLQFIPTGIKRPTETERHSGCDIVKALVESLHAAGNISTFGLIDWDGHQEETKRIAVLSAGVRNGLENTLFDPLIIGLLIWREFPVHRSLVGLTKTDSYFDARVLSKERAQMIVNHITQKVVGNSDATTAVSYLGGLQLDVQSSYLKIDDHKLESLLLAAFPFLGEVKKGQPEKLHDRVLELIYGENVAIIPDDFLRVFKDLINRDPE